MTVEEIRHATEAGDHLDPLTAYGINGWPVTRAEIKDEIQPYWPFWGDIAFIDGIMMRGGRIIIAVSLQQRSLEQLHSNYIGIKKTRLLA